MKMDPRRLLDLLAIARSGSFSSAAEAMNVSQPALSQSVALLEREVGTRVLERGRHGASLNNFGEVLMFHAEALEQLLVRAKEEMDLHIQGIEGPLAIGITPVSAVGFVPRALELLLRETPNVSISLVEGLDNEIIQQLRTRNLDLLVSRVGVQPRYNDVAEEQLFSVDWAVVTGPHHPVARKKSIKLSELTDVQWVLPFGGSAFREQLERVFASAQMDWPSRTISTNSILAIKAVVMDTDCVTIMSPRLVDVEVKAGRLHAVPLEDLAPMREVGLMWRRRDTMSPIAERFANIVRQLVKEENDLAAGL